MCIIVAKPANVEFPSWKTLETCFRSNPDGAGVMYTRNGEVVIEKGFMSWFEFKKAMKQVKRHMDYNGACVMHFRIKTHGEVSRECCHPFPLAGKLAELRQTETTCKLGVAHNGIISGRNTTALKSDTMDYIMNILYPLNKMCKGRIMSDKDARTLVNETVDGCRLVIMDATGNMTFWGSWIEDDGVKYSNTSYCGYRFKATAGSSYYYPYSYDDYLYDDYGYGFHSKHNHNSTVAPNDEKVAAIREYYGFGAEEDYDWDGWQSFVDACPNDDFCWECPECDDCLDGMCWGCATKEQTFETFKHYRSLEEDAQLQEQAEKDKLGVPSIKDLALVKSEDVTFE